MDVDGDFHHNLVLIFRRVSATCEAHKYGETGIVLVRERRPPEEAKNRTIAFFFFLRTLAETNATIHEMFAHNH